MYFHTSPRPLFFLLIAAATFTYFLLWNLPVERTTGGKRRIQPSIETLSVENAAGLPGVIRCIQAEQYDLGQNIFVGLGEVLCRAQMANAQGSTFSAHV